MLGRKFIISIIIASKISKVLKSIASALTTFLFHWRICNWSVTFSRESCCYIFGIDSSVACHNADIKSWSRCKNLLSTSDCLMSALERHQRTCRDPHHFLLFSLTSYSLFPKNIWCENRKISFFFEKNPR